MILLCGIPSESPLRMTAKALDELGAPYHFVNQRDVAGYAITWAIEGGAITGTLRLGDVRIQLDSVQSAYTRLMDDRLLPELEGEPPDSAARRHARGFHEALLRWLEVAPARIVNRADPQGSNGSKPFQAQLLREQGFLVPETLITNDPDAVLEFQRQHGTLIYKSMSGVRSIVTALGTDDLARLEAIRWCPVQFQACIRGTDVRVHVVDREVFPTEIVSDAVDYRYAKRNGGTAELRETRLPEGVADRCCLLARALGLAFAGIDLKITQSGEVYCFEVNPQPAFSFYEANTGQLISHALARHLAEIDP